MSPLGPKIGRYNLLRKALIANAEHEDANVGFDWLLHNVPQSVYNDIERAAGNGDKFSAKML
jgi:hypothetical protein